MKVLMANKFFFLKGGAEKVFFMERNHLISRGMEVVDFAMASPRDRASGYADFFVGHVDFDQPGGVRHQVKTAVSFIHSREATRKIEALLRREKPDIAHLHNIYHQLTPSIIPVLKSHGVKVVLTLHDYKLICPAYLMLKGRDICEACCGGRYWKALALNCRGKMSHGLLNMLEAYWHQWRGSYDRVDRFIAPSRFMAEKMAARIPTDKISVLYNGVDIPPESGADRDEGYALYAGRLSREKGLETLLRAHEILNGRVPLKIAGAGPLLDELSGKRGKVEFLGHLDERKLETAIRNAAFVIVPSEWYENCPLAVLEAMAVGKAVIAADIGGIPEQVDDGRTGLLFESGKPKQLAEKMALLFDQPEMRREMGRRAREKAENCYNWHTHANRLMDIYQTL